MAPKQSALGKTMLTVQVDSSNAVAAHSWLQQAPVKLTSTTVDDMLICSGCSTAAGTTLLNDISTCAATTSCKKL
jgi:hypothetical protein